MGTHSYIVLSTLIFQYCIPTNHYLWENWLQDAEIIPATSSQVCYLFERLRIYVVVPCIEKWKAI